MSMVNLFQLYEQTWFSPLEAPNDVNCEAYLVHSNSILEGQTAFTFRAVIWILSWLLLVTPPQPASIWLPLLLVVNLRSARMSAMMRMTRLSI
jgi:hypothetical protein